MCINFNKIPLIIGLCLGLILLLSPTRARPETEYNLIIGNRPVSKTVLNWNDLLFKNVVRQQYDYSCGSGALATLMNMGFGQNITEGAIIDLILKGKSGQEIQEIEKQGYSLLDLIRVAEELGYITWRGKLPMDQVRQLKGPVLIYFEPRGKKHFAVLKGLVGDRVYLADPALGNIRMKIFYFEKEWPGIILAIDKKKK